jgi:hypothetical protein
VVAVAQRRRKNCAGLSAKRRAAGNAVRTLLNHPFWVGGARLMRFNADIAEEKIVNYALSVVQAVCLQTFSLDINVVENAGARLPKPFACCKHACGGLCCKSDLTEHAQIGTANLRTGLNTASLINKLPLLCQFTALDAPGFAEHHLACKFMLTDSDEWVGLTVRCVQDGSQITLDSRGGEC